MLLSENESPVREIDLDQKSSPELYFADTRIIVTKSMNTAWPKRFEMTENYKFRFLNPQASQAQYYRIFPEGILALKTTSAKGRRSQSNQLWQLFLARTEVGLALF